MYKEQIASIEYLNNKKEIDKYLDNLAENLSICIKCLLEGEQGKYLHYIKIIQEDPCPSIFKDMYVVINNILKNSFDGIENLYMYIECENSIKINRHSPYLSITLHKCYPYYLFGISTFPNSAYHSTALRKFSITIV